jgi:hypothetical protein
MEEVAMKSVNQFERRATWLLAAPVIAAAALAQSAAPPAGAVLVNEVMPLFRAADLLQRRYGVPISYEDPPYEFSDEIEHPPYLSHGMVPRAGRLTVDLSPPLTSPEPSTVATLLQGLVEQHARNGNPGQFKVIQTAAGLAIVAAAVRDSSGALLPYRSPLDARISFPEMERSAHDAVAAFLEATADASGKKLALGEDRVLKWQEVRIGANNEVARDVLARMLTALHAEGRPDADQTGPLRGYKISWSLTMTLPPPGYDGSLRLNQVATEQPGPNGTVVRTPVPR